ncbi:MAG TPA: cytochrome P450 [Sporichthyaceae bacterium]|jgi:cytochrome P450|nr:cytochrome P450 [Sporichthyaceae bacterium]
MAHPKPDYDPVSLSPLSFWSGTPRERDESLRILRAERPVSWHPPAEGSMMPPEESHGFWAVVRNADIRAISTDPDTFVSGAGITLEDLPIELVETFTSFLAMDSPRHKQLRRLCSSAFTPRRVAQIETQIAGQARRVVDDLLIRPEGDLVAAVARRLPMLTIFEMMGVDEDYRTEATESIDGMTAWADEEVRGDLLPEELLMNSSLNLLRIALEIAEARREDPRNDLMTALVQAEVEGKQLTDEEIAAYFVLLAVAGNDTTRNTISHTARAFTEFPEQRKILMEDFDSHISTTVEEMIRWATPVMTFRRTASRDVEFGGVRIAAGDWVGMFYQSGNRDEAAFADPWQFDVLRDPNPHVGFGGGGPHYCLGTMLARAQLRSIWGELLTRVPDLEVGEPDYLVGNFMSSIKRLPYRLNL